MSTNKQSWIPMIESMLMQDLAKQEERSLMWGNAPLHSNDYGVIINTNIMDIYHKGQELTDIKPGWKDQPITITFEYPEGVKPFEKNEVVSYSKDGKGTACGRIVHTDGNKATIVIQSVSRDLDYFPVEELVTGTRWYATTRKVTSQSSVFLKDPTRTALIEIAK